MCSKDGCNNKGGINMIIKCKMCGGTLHPQPNATTCECEFCGTVQTLPKLDSDRRANLYDRANHFRRSNDYDKAMGIFEQILQEDRTRRGSLLVVGAMPIRYRIRGGSRYA